MQMFCKTQPFEIDRLQGIENAFCIAGHGKIVERHYISRRQYLLLKRPLSLPVSPTWAF